MSKHVLVTDAAAPQHFAVWALFKDPVQPGDGKCDPFKKKKNVIDCDRVY